jgi:hypothetical protein
MVLDLISKLKDEKDPAHQAEQERNAKHASAVAYAGRT